MNVSERQEKTINDLLHTFHDVPGRLKLLLREGYSVRHCAEEMGKSKGAIQRLKKKLEGKNGPVCLQVYRCTSL